MIGIVLWWVILLEKNIALYLGFIGETFGDCAISLIFDQVHVM